MLKLHLCQKRLLGRHRGDASTSCTGAASVSGETLGRHRGDTNTSVLELHLCQERWWGETGETQAPVYWSCVCVRRDAGETQGRHKHLCTEAASVSGETLGRHRGDTNTSVLKLHLCQERWWGDTGRRKHLCTEAASVSGEMLGRHRGDASTSALKLHLCQERCWGDTGEMQAPLY